MCKNFFMAKKWRMRGFALLFAHFFAFGLISPASAAPFDIAQTPLYLGGTLEPNLMYIHDDSGSMAWCYLPDNVGSMSSPQYYSSAVNGVYYDPSITYSPPTKADGTSLGNASFNAAWENGYKANRDSSSKYDLSSKFRACQDSYSDYIGSNAAAFYYVFDSSLRNCNGTTADSDCFKKITVSTTSGPGGTDERQNFANWFSYYRTRTMAAQAGISRAFATLGDGIRIGYGRINKSTSQTIDGKSVTTVVRGVRKFKDDPVLGTTDRSDFFTWLFALSPSGGTPLRSALNAVGQYYENASGNGPWSTTPGTSGGEILSCRKSFTILMTDGYWNGAGASTSGATANVDGTAGSAISRPEGGSYTYNPTSPFQDSYSGTLADVAMYYWKRDLLPGTANRVPTTPLDPAFWQHMVTFGIGFGVKGSVDSNAAFAAITSGASITWNNPVSAAEDSPYKIDDLLHAAVNSRGGFYSARNPDEFASAMASTLAAINRAISSASAPAATSTSLQSDTMLYMARYDSGDWSGQFLAYKLCSATDVGTVAGCNKVGDVYSNPSWDASTLIPGPTGRSIYTWKPTLTPPAAVAFQWGNLSPAQQSALGSQDVLNFIRGDTSKEGSVFRSRNGKKLGDIIGSDPFYVGTGDFGYATAAALSGAERTAYKNRRANSSYQNRTPMVYVGANDGMLHAFKANTGDELFAYVPNAVMANLPELSKKTYSHLYYVDGSPKAADALIDGTWKTILVGSTGAGGRAYFALDVEAPTSFGASNVLWEFSSSNDADLGVAMGQASIVRTESGHWVAIFGNGYNGASNTAQLFIVDLKTGAVLKKIDTKVGTADNPNGLGTPVVVDADANGAADLVYAGDMQGNLWKFDLSGSSIASWKIPLGTSDTPVPLFNASYGSGVGAKAQPITDKPQVTRHRPSGGLIVYFGTGQFFETGDQANMDVQSFYGVIDACGRYTADIGCNTYTTVDGKTAKLHRADLLQQSILQEYTETFGSVTSDVRILSANTLDYSASNKQGFYLDLVPPSGIPQGERVVATPLLMDDRVIYTTLIPDSDPCSNGVTGWLMEVDPLSGARTLFSVFDLNNDGLFDKNDNASGGTGSVINGRKLPGGMLKAPALIGGNKYGTNSSGNLTQITQSSSSGVGRQSWRQIR